MFRTKSVLNVGSAFLAAYGFVAFFCFLYVQGRWFNAAPTVPDAARGYIYSHNERGSIAYFSAFQSTSCWVLFWTSIPISFVGILMGPKRNVVHRRNWLSFGATWHPDDPKNLQRVGFILGALAAPAIVFIVGPALVNRLIATGVVLSFG
jgi:hypothetical protein